MVPQQNSLDWKCQLEELLFHLRAPADVVIHSHVVTICMKGIESVIGYRPEPLISEATGMWVITEQVLPTAMIRYSEAIGMWVICHDQHPHVETM